MVNNGNVKAVLVGCHEAANELEMEAKRLLPLVTDSRIMRLRRALRSLRTDQQIQVAQMALK